MMKNGVTVLLFIEQFTEMMPRSQRSYPDGGTAVLDVDVKLQLAEVSCALTAKRLMMNQQQQQLVLLVLLPLRMPLLIPRPRLLLDRHLGEARRSPRNRKRKCAAVTRNSADENLRIGRCTLKMSCRRV